jgi:hypothetical protein
MYLWKLSGLSILERLFIRRPFRGSFKPRILTTMKGEPNNTSVKFPVNSRLFTKHENKRQVFAQRKRPMKTVTIYNLNFKGIEYVKYLLDLIFKVRPIYYETHKNESGAHKNYDA